MQFLKGAFILVGVILVGLSVLLPALMAAATERRGVTVSLGSGYLRSLTPFVTIASMASCFTAAAVILSFEKSKPGRTSILFAVLTFSVFAVEIALSAYISMARAPSPTTLVSWAIYALIGLVPFGLACTMFTLASIVSRAP